MSASDAAPLPRLGEVFFDVRGNSRSMRLSWYADTGVAVFSIWQGGVCTGTFRLPIDDLPRMVETLQRGPGGRARSAPPAPPTGADRYGAAGGAPYGETAVVNQPAYPAPPDYPTDGYPEPDDYDLGYQYDRPAQDQFIDRIPRTEQGSERFVPPYVRGPGDAYPNDNPADERQYQSGYSQPAFPRGPQPGPSDPHQYREAPDRTAAYSEDPRYPIAPVPRRGGYSADPAEEDPSLSLDWPEDDDADLREAGNRGWEGDYRGRRPR
jgi:hypothetical protein